MMFLTGRRIDEETAANWGLVDQLTSAEELRNAALTLAEQIAAGAPLALISTRATLRQGLTDAVRAATDHERAEQTSLLSTEDHQEEVRAVTERRLGVFHAR